QGPQFNYAFAEAQDRLLGISAQTIGTGPATAETLVAAAHCLQATLPSYHTELLRIYLRSPEQLEEALSCYHRTFDGFPPPSVVQGDICREALVVEMDGVFRLARESAAPA
ncbi:MAG: hypothetical protein AAGI15_15855, partial [Pseudomonadota bacterium]